MIDKFERYAVNQVYPFDLPQLEGAFSDFLRPLGNRLLIAINNITKDELKALRKGKLRCGLLVDNGAMMFIWQFCNKNDKPVFTLDTPFDSRLIPDISLYDIESIDSRINIDVHIVDLSTKLLLGLRSITMPPGLTLEFLSAVQDQLANHQADDEQLQIWMENDPEYLSKQTQMWLMGR